MQNVNEKERKPSLRFKDFTDSWEQRKLGEIFKYEQPQSYIVESTDYDDRYETPVLTAGQSFVLGYTDEKFGIKPASKTDPIIIFDDFTTSSHYVDFPFKVKSSAMKLLTLANSKCDIYCAYNVLNNIEYIPVSHERHWISTFANFDVMLPLNYDEQQQIGELFKHLDALITLHQRKYAKLVNIKKSMLEKMFPKNGSSVPEIRFPGFTDAWEQRKLNSIYRSIRNAFVGTATPYYVSEGHFYLESNNVKDGQINRNSEVFINDNFYYQQKDKWLHTNDMVMVQSGHVGHAAVIPEELDNTAAHALIMFSDQIIETNPHFLNYQYQTSKAIKNISDITKGNTIKHILSSDMQNFIVDIPSLEEQKQIGALFKHLDTLITLHQRELEMLQNIKKSCLEKMFV